MDHPLESLLEEPLEPIATRRLVLRRPIMADAPEMARLADDPALARMLARLPHPYTIDHAHAFLENVAAEMVFAVTDGGIGTFLGICGLRTTLKPRAVELGYWIGQQHWGKGFCTEAVQAVIDLAFTRLDIDQVCANCRVINQGSRRVLEKCGFQQRGAGTIISVSAGRVASEDFHLDRRAWKALKAWGRT